MKKVFRSLIGNKVKTEKVVEEKPFDPRTRINSEDMTEEEKLKQGFNGSTYSINGRDVDF
tara:strand:+ start:1481 stop:1660 length:180 start_codon:yes stop_codon:yes gene_type:complete